MHEGPGRSNGILSWKSNEERIKAHNQGECEKFRLRGERSSSEGILGTTRQPTRYAGKREGRDRQCLAALGTKLHGNRASAAQLTDYLRQKQSLQAKGQDNGYSGC